jgi:1,2-phenylacetyl-CoA epoxidase catalytic subunit
MTATNMPKRCFYFTPEELPEESKKYIIKMLTVQLQSEYADAPDRSGAVCPTVEDKSWLDLQLAQEKQHGLGVSLILRSLGVDAMPYIKEAEASVQEGSRKLDYFRIRMDNWVERTLTRVLAERTGAIQTVAGLGGWYVPLAIWHAKNYMDEALGHTVQGVRYTRDLIAQGKKEECQSAVNKFYPSCLDIFGGVNTPNEKKYLELGIKTLSNNQTRYLWMRSLEKDLNLLGLEMPKDRWRGDRQEYRPEDSQKWSLYLSPDESPERLRGPLARLLSVWIQSKYGRQSDHIVFSAPSPEEKLAVALQLKQEKAWGLEVAKLMRGLGIDPNPLADEAERSPQSGRYKLEFLKRPLPKTWEEICVKQLLAARAAAVGSLATFGSCLIPLAAWSGLHYEGESNFAEAWKERLKPIIHTGGGELCQRAVTDWYPDAVDLFGGDGTKNELEYCNLGIKTATNAHVREIFLEFVERDLGELGLRMPEARHGRRAKYRASVRPEHAGRAEPTETSAAT